MKKFLSLLAALCLACALAAPALADAPTVGGTIEEAVAISADTTWDEATTLAANLTVNPGVTLTLNAGVTVSGKVTVSGGGTIQRGEGFTGVMVRVLGKEDLTADLTLENITLDGGAVWGTAYNETYDGTDRTVFDILGHSTQNTGLFNSDQIIKIEGKSTLNLKSGAIIQNNDTSSDGSGALNGDKGGSRGAVTILSASTCNIYDGAIVRNNLGTNGGGIQIKNADTTLNMYGGELYGNIATKTGYDTSGGGAIYMGTQTSHLYGGVIRNNVSMGFGGGFSHFGGTLYLYGEGEGQSGINFSKNYAADKGSAIYGKDNVATLYMYGGIIQNNTGGCAVHIPVVPFYLYGGTVSNNTGGGIQANYKVAALQGDVYIWDNYNEDGEPYNLNGGRNSFNVTGPLTGKIGRRNAYTGGTSDITITRKALEAGATAEDVLKVISHDDENFILRKASDTKIVVADAIRITLNNTYGNTDNSPVVLKTVKNSASEMLVSPVRIGYIFSGWTDSSNKLLSTSEIDALANGAAINAQWASEITFDVNGGVCETASAEIAEGSAYSSLPVPTRTGYTLNGWYTARTGGEKVETTTVPTGNTTLYAQWRPNTYTISFNGGEGASGSMTQQDAAYDTPATLPANGFTMSDKNFAGWDTDSSADEVVYSGGAQVKNLTAQNGGAVTLYTVWTSKAVLAPSLEVQSKIYNGAAQAFQLDGFALSYWQNCEKVTQPVNVGAYDVEIRADETDDTAAYRSALYGGLVIEKAVLTVTADDKAVYVGGTLPAYTFTVSGWQGSDEQNVTLEGISLSCAHADANLVGDYPITISGPDALDNYAIVYKSGMLSVRQPEPGPDITPDTGLALDQTILTLEPGGTAKLKVTLTPADATYKHIFWTSSDETIAAVSNSGLVTARAEGTAIVTAKSWYGNEAFCTVTVNAADKPTLPTPSDPWPTEGLAGFVTRLYREALGRDPDQAGHDDWVRWLSDGTVDAKNCAYGFVFSKEMNDKNLSDKAFAETLYKVFMGREGEATGVAFWTDYLAQGHTRQEVFDGFADSKEFSDIERHYSVA